MRLVTWAIRLVLLALLAAFAAKNVDPVTLRFYFDWSLQSPLIVLLFCAFAAGALFGILAMLGTVLRQRREIASLRRERGPVEPPVPPAPF
jgi:putative membrane protein